MPVRFPELRPVALGLRKGAMARPLTQANGRNRTMAKPMKMFDGARRDDGKPA